MEVRRYLAVEGAEEVAIFHYLNFARKQKRLTLKEEKKLLARSRSGDREATETLVDANQNLIVALSETYDDDRLSLMDRVAEGNVALISACRTYLPRLDGSFRRYCQLKIRKAIEYALAEVASFRVVVRCGSGSTTPKEVDVYLPMSGRSQIKTSEVSALGP